MSEYWVSQAKYYCKICCCYIADNKPSRQHHDNGLKHKQKLEQFQKQRKHLFRAFHLNRRPKPSSSRFYQAEDRSSLPTLILHEKRRIYFCGTVVRDGSFRYFHSHRDSRCCRSRRLYLSGLHSFSVSSFLHRAGHGDAICRRRLASLRNQ